MNALQLYCWQFSHKKNFVAETPQKRNKEVKQLIRFFHDSYSSLYLRESLYVDFYVFLSLCFFVCNITPAAVNDFFCHDSL